MLIFSVSEGPCWLFINNTPLSPSESLRNLHDGLTITADVVGPSSAVERVALCTVHRMYQDCVELVWLRYNKSTAILLQEPRSMYCA
jgi:hypothetical protein